MKMGSSVMNARLDVKRSVETRTAERFVPKKAVTFLMTSSGKSIAARIINMSASGVAVEANISNQGAKEIVKVGSHPVKPGRKIALGMVFRFVTPIDPKSCNPDIVL